MVVQHNISAMNANRMLGVTTRNLAASTEKLSSGYKINRASDNAAGLSISEKMRRQIRGLTRSAMNAEDGISATQTAEGALQEVTDMLQRMNELSVQAANGTNVILDREYIQDEMDELIGEIDRVSESTKFNEIYILKGDAKKGTDTAYRYNYIKDNALNVGKNSGAVKNKILCNSNANMYFVDNAVLDTYENCSISAEVRSKGEDVTKYLTSATVGLNSEVTAHALNTNYVVFQNAEIPPAQLTLANGTITAVTDTYLFDTKTNNVIRVEKGNDLSGYLQNCETANANDTGPLSYLELKEQYRTLKRVGGEALGAGGSTAGDGALTNADFKSAVEERQLYDANGHKVSSNALGKFFNENGLYQGGLFTDSLASKAVSANEADDSYFGNYIRLTSVKIMKALSFELQVGNDSDRHNRIMTSVESFSADALGVSNLKRVFSGIVDDSGDKATDAIDIIAAAIKRVSSQRSNLGAMQNRLEHTIKNLDNVVENTTRSESQIRDTDMAKEMVRFSSANIISQAGQSMLTQANQSKQGVLSLLS